MHTFQQDNASLLEWPALFPDLSTIVHLLNYLDQRISPHPQMNSLRELENTLYQEWNVIPKEHYSQTFWINEKSLHGLYCCTWCLYALFIVTLCVFQVYMI